VRLLQQPLACRSSRVGLRDAGELLLPAAAGVAWPTNSATVVGIIEERVMVAEFGDAEHVVNLDGLTLAAVELQLTHDITLEYVTAGGLRHGALAAVCAHVSILLEVAAVRRRYGSPGK
jgi:hypothetical protein